MGLKDIKIEPEYRNLHQNVLKNFFIPILSESVVYKRSVGFFSSSALACFSYGLCKFLENGGRIELVTSPDLSKEDLEAMEAGYEAKEQIIQRALLKGLKDPINKFEEDRLNMLANLIAEGRMEIKIAVTKSGMYHEKLGIVQDLQGDYIAFSGSSNESANAFLNNYEAIDVFRSWVIDPDDRARKKYIAFDKIWNRKDPSVNLYEVPNLPKEIIDRYRKKPSSFAIDEEEFLKKYMTGKGPTSENEIPQNIPTIPQTLDVRDYQNDAVESWKQQKYRGIFDMATGTGKTITALIGVTRLYEEIRTRSEKLFVVIVCPYQHLVEQWVEDIKAFNIKPIIGFSASPQKDWTRRLDGASVDFLLPQRKKDFACFICTNATFSKKYVQDKLDQISVPKLLVVDEAHNFGAPYLLKCLKDSYAYRMALSATINRQGDEEGTEALFNYFGKKCIEYDIERAIREEKLTKYKYYPVVVSLDNDELTQYKQLTEELNRCIASYGGIKNGLNDKAKKIAMRRARLIAGAKSKIDALKKSILPYKNESYILVYCGATTILDPNADFTDVNETDKRQICYISQLLGNELNITNHHFTSNENIQERELLKDRFSKGELQALIAIKCLDEGVNIPSIKTAFILASTTNPKEYIQRRGRVLRLAKGKKFAEIYDFIVLPYQLENVRFLTEFQINEVKSLVKRELLRADEFARISLNKAEANVILNQIRDAYQIHEELNNTTIKEA